MGKCYECKYRGTVLGSVHSSCKSLREICDNTKDVSLLELLIGSGSVQMTVTDSDSGKTEPIVSLNEHGVKNGWANWPIDFDPIWVDKCKLFKEII